MKSNQRHVRSLLGQLKEEQLPELQEVFAKAMTAIFLFDFLDRLAACGFPEDWVCRLESELGELGNAVKGIARLLEPRTEFSHFEGAKSPEELAAKTGEVYYQLWKDFSPQEYFRQTAAILGERFEKNGLSVAGMDNALDDGCGSGRYTLALKSLGCQRVTGYDISPNSLAFAQSKNPFPTSEVQFRQGSVLELPFRDGEFDFVFSNGVLHHTASTEKGLAEIFRVLKPGGKCWLYLYGGKDSFFWDVVDCCRELLKKVPQEYTQTLMKCLGYPPGRIFHRCDFFYVPINHRYFSHEVEEILKRAGFSKFRRLLRGADHDWDEIIFSNPEIDSYIYGEGEMRYWIEKE